MADIEEEAAELRTLIAEAHGQMKDLNRERREVTALLAEVEKAKAELRELVDDAFATHIEQGIENGLAAYAAAITAAIESTEGAVFRRFDEISDTLLGLSNKKDVNDPSIIEMAYGYREYMDWKAEQEKKS